MTEQTAAGRLDRSTPRVVAEGLGWPEGPTCLDDGSIAFVETYRGRISRWSPETGEVTTLAKTGGGPNAALAGRTSRDASGDEVVHFTQNGGIVGPWRATEQRAPGIWRVAASGAVEPVVTDFDGEAFGAPNDLAFGPDGRLYFTDPAEDFRIDDPQHSGRIYAIDDPTSARPVVELVVEAGMVFPNGLAFDPDGTLYWTETYAHRVMRLVDGAPEVFVELQEGTAPDGLTFSDDGLLLVTTGAGAGRTVEILSARGEPLDSLRLLPDSTPSNCQLVGQTLYVTDGGCDGDSVEARLTGRLWAIDLAHVRGIEPPSA